MEGLFPLGFLGAALNPAWKSVQTSVNVRRD
jgi:hypothetical protein